MRADKAFQAEPEKSMKEQVHEELIRIAGAEQVIRDEDKLPALAAEIADKMHDSIKVRPEITWIPPMTLERSAHKTQFIEKAYEG